MGSSHLSKAPLFCSCVISNTYFRSVDFAKVLTELGQELKFEVGFIDVDEKTEDDQVQFLVQLSTLPVYLSRLLFTVLQHNS